MTSLRNAGARLFGETRDGVLSASVTGLVTASDIIRIRAELAPAASTARAVLIDYSRSVLAITGSCLDRLFRTEPPGPCVLVMAWVVPGAEAAALWQHQVDRYALMGLRRFVTHRPTEAQVWCLDQVTQAAVRLAQRTARR